MTNPPAYEPLPQRAAAPAARSAKVLGAGIAVVVAAVCGVAWKVQSRGPAAAPAAPLAEAAPEAPALEGASEAREPRLPSAYRELEPLSVAGEGVTQEAAAEKAWAAADLSAPSVVLAAAAGWAALRPIQRWLWPRRFEAMNLQAGQKRQVLASESRRLLGWFPDNAQGRRLLFGLRQPDGTERELYEEELPRPSAGVNWRQRMIESIMLRNGAASAKEVKGANGKAMLELTYADGTKKVVPFDPLVFDLTGKGVATVERKVLFDLAVKGADNVQWMNDFDEGTGILIFDSNKSGRPGKSGAEVFGDRTDLDGDGKADGFANGFEALRGLVVKAEKENVLPAGTLASGELEGPALRALEKAYGLRMRVGGFNKEPVTLDKAGVAAIRLSAEAVTRVENFDARANDLVVQPGAVFRRADGTTGNYMNVFLAAKVGNLGLRKLVARDRR
jgi:hypothetical protein